MVWMANEHTRALFDQVGGKDRIIAVCDRFYLKLFDDAHLYRFVKSPGPKHGVRLGLWLAEKLSGEAVWTETRPPNSRSRSHAKAWTSPKREPERQGRRFKLEDTRAWMRLMFWAAREEGLDQNREFFRLFVQLIQHFIGVYEWSAPPFAVLDAKWSLTDGNIAKYIADGRVMTDVLGIEHADPSTWPSDSERDPDCL